MKKLLIISSLFVLFGLTTKAVWIHKQTTAPVFAFTNAFFVSNSGDDANNGWTLATAFATLQKGATMSTNGCALYLDSASRFDLNSSVDFTNDGVYVTSTGWPVNNSWVRCTNPTGCNGFTVSNASITIGSINFSTTYSNSATASTASDRLVSFFRNTNYPSGFVVITNCNFTNSHVGIYVSSTPSGLAYEMWTNCTITGCTTTNTINCGIQFIPGGAPTAFSPMARNGYVAHNKIGFCVGVTNSNTTFPLPFWGCTNFVVEDNYIHHCGTNSGQGAGGPAGIIINYGGRFTIQSNVVSNIKGVNDTGNDGIGINPGTGSTECCIQYNYIYGCTGPGIQIDQTVPNCTVRFNILSANSIHNTGQLLIQGNANTGLKVYNNVFNDRTYNSASANALSILGGGHLTPTNWVANNIFLVEGTKYPIEWNPASSGATTNIGFHGNLYYDYGKGSANTKFGWGSGGATYLGIANFRTGSSQETGTGFCADPLMWNSRITTSATNIAHLASVNFFKISTNSPAYLTGLNLNTLHGVTDITNDIFGTAVTASTLSVGAIQSTYNPGRAVDFPGLYSSWVGEFITTNLNSRFTTFFDNHTNALNLTSVNGATYTTSGNRGVASLETSSGAHTNYFFNQAITNHVATSGIFDLVMVAKIVAPYSTLDQFIVDGGTSTNRLQFVEKAASGTSNAWFIATGSTPIYDSFVITNKAEVWELLLTNNAGVWNCEFRTNNVMCLGGVMNGTNVQGLTFGSRYSLDSAFAGYLLMEADIYTNNLGNNRTANFQRLTNIYGIVVP